MKVSNPKIYLDTSVPSSFYDTHAPEQTGLTRLFWEDYLEKFACYISGVTLAEIQRTKQPQKRRKIQELVAKLEVLKLTSEIENLAEAYLKKRIVQQANALDASHIACATFYKIDFLVSWNIRHLVNPNKRKKLTEYNTSVGLFVPQLTTPEELIKTYGKN